MEENDSAEHGFHIEELAWLKQKDNVLGEFASGSIQQEEPNMSLTMASLSDKDKSAAWNATK